MLKHWFYSLFLLPTFLSSYIVYSDEELNIVRKLYHMVITKTDTSISFTLQESTKSNTPKTKADIQILSEDATFLMTDVNTKGSVEFKYQVKVKGNPSFNGGYLLNDIQMGLRMNRSIYSDHFLSFQAIQLPYQTTGSLTMMPSQVNQSLNIQQMRDGNKLAFWSQIQGEDQIFLSTDYTSRFLFYDLDSYQKTDYEELNLSVVVRSEDIKNVSNGSFYYQWYLLMDPITAGTTQEKIDSVNANALDYQKVWINQEITFIDQILGQQLKVSTRKTLNDNKKKLQAILDRF